MKTKFTKQVKVVKSTKKTKKSDKPEVTTTSDGVTNSTTETQTSKTVQLRTLYNGIDFQGFTQKELDYEMELYMEEKKKYTGEGKSFLRDLPIDHPLIQSISKKWSYLVYQWDKFRIPVGGNKSDDVKIINDFKQLRNCSLNDILLELNDGTLVLWDFTNLDSGLNQHFPEMLDVPTINGSIIDGFKDFKRFLYGYEDKILNNPTTIVNECNVYNIFKQMCRLSLGTTPVVNFPSRIGMFILMESYYETILLNNGIQNDNFVFLDHCSGWSSRLLSTLCVFNRMREHYRRLFKRELHVTYLSTDPNDEVHERFDNIILDWFDHIEPKDTRPFFHFHKETMGCETPEFLEYCKRTLNLYGLSGVNVSLTSPPYFNREKYSKDPSQSYLKYKTYPEWRIKFLKGMIDNVHELLNPGGCFYLNISNTYEPNGIVNPMETDSVTFFQGCGMKPVKTYKMLLSSTGSSKSVNFIGDDEINHKFEPIFVFEK